MSPGPGKGMSKSELKAAREQKHYPKQKPIHSVGDQNNQKLDDGSRLPALGDRLHHTQPAIDFEKFVKPTPDAKERRHDNEGDCAPYMIDSR
eukprot:CAMPEP_0201532936 /NCGR_PEP_ID=MMETSP0161_2-20130828/51695_1 /ASSEMBLY_ACC=CAM_ASM_000251 /TAXON_ID=180227 /ORGANISM="Neoparamoeba aestuarina, Strain SoJaBio B1-5/56/2" /LENGTH=91 /DNA_ID=CAMNT_0047936625 /DNA_START=96 /DNA_END=367 /DNA_ORIENTATION=+